MDGFSPPSWASGSETMLGAITFALAVLSALALAPLLRRKQIANKTIYYVLVILNVVWPYAILKGYGAGYLGEFSSYILNEAVAAAIAGRILYMELQNLQPLSSYGKQNSLNKVAARIGFQLALFIIPARLFMPYWDAEFDFTQMVTYASLSYVMWKFIHNTGAWKMSNLKYAVIIGAVEGMILLGWTYTYLSDIIFFEPISLVIMTFSVAGSSAFYAVIIYALIVWIVGKNKSEGNTNGSQADDEQQSQVDDHRYQ